MYRNYKVSETWFTRYSYWLLAAIFITLPLFPKGISWLPTLVFIIALGYIIKYPREIFQKLNQSHYTAIFLAFFIPGIISLIDSLSMGLTLNTLWRFVRYSGFSVLALFLAQNNQSQIQFERIMFFFILFVCLDAMAHWLFEYNIYGHNPLPGDGSRVRGVFKEMYHLSYYVATLSPLIFFYLAKKIKEKSKVYLVLAPFVIGVMFLTVLVGGARAGLITLIVSILLFVVYLWSKGWIANKGRFCLSLFIFALVIGLIASQSEVIQKRLHRTTTVHEGQEFLDRFTSHRTNIWNVTVEQIPNYWINGVGLRGFDAIYQTYPEDYKLWAKVNHPHMHILEVMIETGIIGLVPYLIVCLYLLIQIYRVDRGGEWLMVSFLAIMPINSHAGLYEGQWLPMVWVPLALGLLLAHGNCRGNIMGWKNS